MTAHEQFEQDLPLYAMGTLSPAESDAIEAHLESCAACRRELQYLRGDLAILALSVETATPPKRSRQRLLSAIARESRPLSARRARWMLIPFALSAFLAIFVALLWRENYSLTDRLRQSESRLIAEQATFVRAQHLLGLMTDPDAMHVTLVAGKTKPQPHGRAMYAPRTGALVFMASNMPVLPSHKMYELWLLPKSGTPPVPAGMFRPDASGNAMVMMPPLPAGLDASTFAVTVEPESGSATPTMPMVLSGAGE
ncbi:MAG TPA: anti-sigma factor [Terriglobales bacterium]|nr:anti-sigma factor [Terriglobales bacterium]